MVAPSFYIGSTIQIAKKLLGLYLVHESSEGVTVGRIVETEAYLSRNDPACHASKGMTARNAPMFGPSGTAYVYLIYGMYHCFNVVTGREGKGEAVLIRALEPVYGLSLMRKRRGQEESKNLCSGPGKLVQAMGIHMGHNRALLLPGGSLSITRDYPELPRGRRKRGEDIFETTRIGISEGAELPLRYYLQGNVYISKK